MAGKKIPIANCAIPTSFLREIASCLKLLKPSRVMIFGSSLMKGLEARDIDIAIISDRFSNIIWNERRFLVTLPEGPKYDMNLLTESEFEALSDYHILKEGLEMGHICWSV
jgi:predicted nucleotidyltransferase